MKRNPTRTYLNAFYAMVRAFAPERRFSITELNGAWRRAPEDQRPRVMCWLRSDTLWRPLEPPGIDPSALS